jgi:hypothetical protein
LRISWSYRRRAQALPGHVAVAVLAAAVLALHHDAGRDVRQPHRRVGLVDVLAAGAAGAEGVGAHVGRVDLDLDRVVDLGVDEQAGEAGVAAAGAVERALAHQAVHAGFGAQVAEGVVALDLDGGALDAGHVAFGLVFTSALKPLRSQYFRYWRSSMLAQSQASVPPAPAWMSMKQFSGSAGLLNMRRNSSCSTVVAQRVRLGLDRAQAVLVAFGLGHVEQLGVVDRLLAAGGRWSRPPSPASSSRGPVPGRAWVRSRPRGSPARR